MRNRQVYQRLKPIAWTVVVLAAGVVLTQAIALWTLLISIPIALFIEWKLWAPNIRISLKKGRVHKMFFIIGCFVVLGGLGLIAVGIVIQRKPHTTVVSCCITGNTYQVVVKNSSKAKDTVFVTIGTDGRISEVKALMGAKDPTIIEGGPNANFVTFKVEEVLPDMSLNYLVTTLSSAKQPRNFSAWSEETKNSISTRFDGECPRIISIGPEETSPQSR